jgi:hypothetical protein
MSVWGLRTASGTNYYDIPSFSRASPSRRLAVAERLKRTRRYDSSPLHWLVTQSSPGWCRGKD